MLAHIALLALLQTASPAAPPPAPPSPGAACTAAAFHQFDFWIGEWEVTNQQAPAGRRGRRRRAGSRAS
jgi:hypothetical protein